MTVLAHTEKVLARLARLDFDVFVEFAGADDDGQPLIQRPLDTLVWHFVEECHRDNAPAGVMLPMGFGKTTQFCYRAAWEIGRDPNALVSIVTDSGDNSKERVELIRKIIDREPYRRVFPHIRVMEGKDEKQRFTVERTGLSKDPTCTAEGVLTGTGTRTNFPLMDDVVTLRNSILEPLNRRRVIEAIRTTWMSRTKIASDKPVRIALIQTSYHMADAAAVLREDPLSGWRFLVVRAEEPYEMLTWERWEKGALATTGTVECPFPAEAVAERARQMGPTAAARGLGNRPVSGEECVFQPEHFMGPFPMDAGRYDRRILFADPAGDATKAKTGETDWCACVAVGWDRDAKAWDAYLASRMRGPPSKQAEFIALKAREARVRIAFVEATKDEALVEQVQKLLREQQVPISVRGEKPVVRKETRIAQILEPPLSTGLLRVCGRAFPDLAAEALAFPAGAHDDLLDALAGAFARIGSGWSMFGSGEDALARARSNDDEEDNWRSELHAMTEPSRSYGITSHFGSGTSPW